MSFAMVTPYGLPWQCFHLTGYPYGSDLAPHGQGADAPSFGRLNTGLGASEEGTRTSGGSDVTGEDEGATAGTNGKGLPDLGMARRLSR